MDFYRPNIRKLGNVTIVVPLISIIEIEALYWLLFRNTLLRYAFYLHIQSEFSIVLLWLVTSLRDFQCVYATKTTEKTSRHQLFLLSRVSHEIRTPLFGIVGIVDILDESFVTEEQKKLLATVKACCETALNVVNEILDWSKSENGKLVIQSKPFDLEALVEKVKCVVLPLLQQKKLQLNYSKGDEVPRYIVGDEQRLKQILLNLLTNAAKFTDEGTIHLQISLFQTPSLNHSLSSDDLSIRRQSSRLFLSSQDIITSRPKEYIRFTITDTGVGITREQIKELFRPYSQLLKSHASVGTGLGLFICKKFVKAMGGDISVSSEGVDNGTTFSFSIPLCRCDQESLLVSSPNISNPSIKLPCHILVVEDNGINQMILKRQLTHLGCTYEVAGNGFLALQTLQENPERFSLILMDIEMPILDGISATKEIRQRLKLTRVPIIALTAHALPEHQDLVLACGMQALLSKPFREQELKNVLTNFLSS